MKHLFVPYHICVLAKEKGYTDTDDLPFWYDNHGLLHDENDRIGYKYIKAPLYQQLIDWFENKHGLLIHRVMGFHKNHICVKLQNINNDKNVDTFQGGTPYELYNQALEEAFKLI